jgi:carboxypeptidase Q
MQRRIILGLGVIFSAFFCSAFGQQTDSAFLRRLSMDVMNSAAAYENLKFLCKKIGPRLSGSPQAQEAVLVSQKMLKAAGADTVYLQPLKVPHWVRGGREQAELRQANGKKIALAICALGNSVGTGQKGITAPVIQVQTMAELEQLGAATIKGKIVFFNGGMNPAHIQTFNAYAETGVFRRTGAAKAARLGAVAVVVRSLASNPTNFPHTGVTSYNDSFPKIPAVAISTNDADKLSRLLMQKIASELFLKTTCAMLPDETSFNVVGEWRGTVFPEKIITVGGHLDSWDLAEGAHDDGAGVVQSIEVIRALKATAYKPRHTLRAVLFMNEENGGAGAKKYLELAVQNKEQHLFALESDAGGFTPRGFSIDAADSMVAKLAVHVPLLLPYGVYEIKKGGSGADVGPLKTIGAVTAGLRPDSQRYFDVHHAATDVFETVSRRELQLGAFNMAALIYLVDQYGL